MIVIKVNNEDYQAQDVNVTYNVDGVISVSIATTDSLSTAFEKFHNYNEITIEVEGDTYSDLYFLSVSKRYGGNNVYTVVALSSSNTEEGI